MVEHTGTSHSRHDAAVEKHLPLRPTVFQILLSLAAGTGHGYGIKREVEARTEGRVRLAAGTLYETIQRLERDGLIRETSAPEHKSTTDKKTSRWRFYRLTTLGSDVLSAQLTLYENDLVTARELLASARTNG